MRAGGPPRSSSGSGSPARRAPPGEALGRDAPARRVPAHAPRGQAGAAARRAVRGARRDHARRAAGLASPTRSPPSHGRCCSSPTTSRRRSCSATRVLVLARRARCRRARRRRAARGAAPRDRDEPGLRRAARAGAGGDRMRRAPALRSRCLPPRSGVGSSSCGLRASRTTSSPRPSAVVSSLVRRRPASSRAPTPVTCARSCSATCSRFALALALAVVLHFSAVLRRALLPILVLSQTVPRSLLAPILAILLGYGIEPKLVVVAVVCFFPIVVNTVDGLRSTDPELVRMMRTLARPPARRLPPRRAARRAARVLLGRPGRRHLRRRRRRLR